MKSRVIKKIQAVTIIELTIVLIVLGLLVATTLVGTELIQQAKIRQLAIYISETEQAIYQFKSQYNYLPGDYPHAISFWNTGEFTDKCTGYDNGTTLVNFDATISGFDGNGDGIVDNASNMASPKTAPTSESAAVFCHLALGQFIKPSDAVITYIGSPSGGSAILPTANAGGGGTTSGATSSPAATQAAPASSKKSGILLGKGNAMYLIGKPQSYTGKDFAINRNKLYVFGGQGSSAPHPSTPSNATMTPKEIFALDNKLDDGKPGSGKVIMFVKNNGKGALVPCCVGGTDGDVCPEASQYAYNATSKNSCYISYNSGIFN